MTRLGDKNIVELRNTVEMVNRILELIDAYEPTLILILRTGGSNRLLGSRRWSGESRWRRKRDRELGLAITAMRFTYCVIYIVNDVLLAFAV
jgi:hypothetical protein